MRKTINMGITSLKLSKIYSFGHSVTLEGFTDFNLFIGSNGAGKTNVFRVLDGLPFDMKHIGKVSLKTSTHTAGVINNNVDSYIPVFGEISNHVINKDTFRSDVVGCMEINYEIYTKSKQAYPKKEQIKCSENPDGFMQVDTGDIISYAHRTKIIQLPETDFEFFRNLATFFGCKAASRLPFLNVGLYYIFNLHYIFEQSGNFIQGKLKRGGTVEESFTSLPSGVLNIAKLLTQILISQNKSVLLIDEPELHLEPRHIRRLFDYLVWYSLKSKDHSTKSELNIAKKVDLAIKDHGDAALVEDKIGNTLQGKQIFIASHSPVFINEFIQLGSAASIYEFSLERAEFTKKDLILEKSGIEVPSLNQTETGLFSKVRKVSDLPSTILDELGCRGSDLLQCNGVIWVEGPSDVIFIQKWLEMFAEENNKDIPVQGRDYEFQMFGGTLLDSLSLVQAGNDSLEERKKLVSMFSFSKNAFVIIDSDAIKNKEGIIVDNSNFTAAKSYIKNQFEELNCKGFKLGIWYDEGITETATIEDYLDVDSKKSAPASATKKNRARLIVDSWPKEKTLYEINDKDLISRIEELFEVINSWKI